MKTTRFRSRPTIGLLALLLPGALLAQEPIARIPVGDTPFALDLADDGRSVVVVNLFPDAMTGTNVRTIDISSPMSPTVLSEARVGTRLVAVDVTPNVALIVNEDQDTVFLVDPLSGAIAGQVDVGSRPSNILAAGDFAFATNGTSGDISIIDLQTQRVVNTLPVGIDPRAIAIDPSGRFAFVALGGEDALAVLDLQDQGAKGAVTTVPVGKDPVDVAVSGDGSRAIVANASNNTISVLDVSDPTAPKVLPTPEGGAQLPVGALPIDIALLDEIRQAIISNLGSEYLTVVDVDEVRVLGVVPVVRPSNDLPGEVVSSPTSGVVASQDEETLFVTEFSSNAELLIYLLDELAPQVAPPVDIPGEPGGDLFLGVVDAPCPGFYVAEVELLPGARGGFWSLEVLATAGERLLQGGFNLGGTFGASGADPGFGAFNITNAASEPQRVDINVAAQPLDGSPLAVQITIQAPLTSGDAPIREPVVGVPPFAVSEVLEPGFYVVRIAAADGSPAGNFQLGLETSFVDRPGGGFQGGVNVGGLLTRRDDGSSTVGFGAFCIADPQDIVFNSFGGTFFGTSGAGDFKVTVRDGNLQREVATLDTSIPVAPTVLPPDPPAVPASIDLYVDDDGPDDGDGSAARPFPSITRAISAASAGDVILVRPGLYAPSRTGEVIPLGSAGIGVNPLARDVQLIGSGAATTIIDAEGTIRPEDGNGNALVIPASGVRVAGFTVRGAAAVGVFAFEADRVRVDRNFLTSNARFGIGAFGASGLLIDENVVVSNRETGIAVSNTPRGPSRSDSPARCPDRYGACIVDNLANDNRADGFLASQGGDVYILDNGAFNNGSAGIELNNRADNGPPGPLDGEIVGNELVGNGGQQFAFAGSGILITEGARARLIGDNRLNKNRPFGIGVFIDATADEISDNLVDGSTSSGILVQRDSVVDRLLGNQVTNSGLSGFFIENAGQVNLMAGNRAVGNGTCTTCSSAKAGLAVLQNSNVNAIDGMTIDRNTVGLEVANGSRIGSASMIEVLNSEASGAFVRTGSAIEDLAGLVMRGNRGQAGLIVSGGLASIRTCEIIGNADRGFSVADGASLTLTDCRIERNGPDGGGLLSGGSTLALSNSTLIDNAGAGLVAGGAGTEATLDGGNTVRGNTDFGLNAQNGASIRCRGSNAVSGNTPADTLGDVTGC